jgi:4'-phosphopantetheinyl transferase
MNPSLATLPPPAAGRPSPGAGQGARLRADEVELWRAELDAQTPAAVQCMESLISADEAERARRFYFERDRRRFVIGRGILRTLLGRHLGIAPKEIEFRYGANGKPAVAGQDGSPLFFNVAHSEGLALYAFTRVGEVGVDAERIRDLPEWETIATSYFSPRELGRIYERPAARRAAEFFHAWTRQEALLKAHGIGLGGAVGRGRGTESEPQAMGQSANGSFAVYPLAPAVGFVGALAVGPGARWTLHYQWQAAMIADDAGFAARSRRVRLKSLSETGPVSS